MDNVESTVLLITEGCYMASVDLKHDYYSVPIHKEDQKYLQFQCRGQLFQFTCLVMGLTSSPEFSQRFASLFTLIFEISVIA